MCRSYYASPLPSAWASQLSIIHCWGELVNYCSYTGIVILALIIFENIFFLILCKRNIMRESCGSSGTKSLHLFFSLRELMNEGDIPHSNVCYQLVPFTWLILADSSIARMGILIQQAAEHPGDSLSPVMHQNGLINVKTGLQKAAARKGTREKILCRIRLLCVFVWDFHLLEERSTQDWEIVGLGMQMSMDNVRRGLPYYE